MDVKRELRRASDSLLDRLDRVRALEEEKRREMPGSPRFEELAAEVDELSREAVRWAERENILTRHAPQLTGRPLTEVVPEPIDAIEPRADAARVFQEWHEAERTVAALTPGTPECDEAIDLARRLRDEYVKASQAVDQLPE